MVLNVAHRHTNHQQEECYNATMRRHFLLAGSRVEAVEFANRKGLTPVVIVTKAHQLYSAQGHDIAHLIGTVAYKPSFKELRSAAEGRFEAIVDHTRPPWCVYAPSLRIAHVFADRLGISSER